MAIERGTKILVRTRNDGLLCGRLDEMQPPAYLLLTEVRRVWRWEGGALDSAGIAERGADRVRADAVAPWRLVNWADMCGVGPVTDEAWGKIMSAPVDTGT